MRKAHWFAIFCLAGLLAPALRAQQPRPYIGFTYPAGGQQGTTFPIRIGGQGYEEVTGAIVSGTGVSVKLVEYHRQLNNQEESLLTEQLRDLRRAKGKPSADSMMAADSMMMMAATSTGKTVTASSREATRTNMIAIIEKRVRERVQTPASRAISTLAFLEVTIAPDATPGEREIRLVTLRGVSNPLAFHVGQVPEHTRNAMRTSLLQVLGKEASALRKRPAEEAEERISIPCTMNGQIASGEVNSYRFTATKGQRLVITTLGRQLIPYLADAVPGWFQPVLALYDATGKEMAYNDDYRFKPDPVIFYEVPKDGEYVLAIRDSIYRGREDFIYRITIGELPFVTSIFPLGGRVGEPVEIKMKGRNLDGAELTPPAKDAGAGIQMIAANRKGFLSNRVPFALDTLPECFDREPNDSPSRTQKVTLPIIINGRIDKEDDWDVFQFTGKSNETVVAEVYARRLDSPLDSVLKLTDAKGKLLAFSDDREDIGSGLNTHHADSYITTKLPADGTYYVHIGDTARKGGEEYAYRLRISAPRPDFTLRVVPSSISLRSKGFGSLGIYVIRHDGFNAPIKLAFKNTTDGFTAQPVSLTGSQAMTRIQFKTDLVATKTPHNLLIEGRAKTGDQEIVSVAVPAEDRMQAFLWRHLVPAKEMSTMVFDPTYTLPPKHIPPARPVVVHTNTAASATSTNATATLKGKFTKGQVAFRVREIKRLYEEGLITDEFYNKKLDECEALQ